MANLNRYHDPSSLDRVKIPTGIVEDLNFVEHAISDAETVWRLIDQIFNVEDSWDLLDEASYEGFRLIFDALVEATILSVARLNDPAKTSGKENVTLASLLARIQEHGDAALITEVTPGFDKLKALARESQQLRHKALAHADRAHAFGAIEPVEVALKNIWEFFDHALTLINQIRAHFGADSWSFDDEIGGDFAGIIKSLRALNNFRKLRDEACRTPSLSGEYLREHLLRADPL